MLGSFAGTGIQRPGGEKWASRTTSVRTSLQAKGCRSCFSNSRLCQAPPCVPSMHLCVKLGNQLSRTFPGDGGPLLAWTTPCWKSLEYTVHEPEYQTKFRGHGPRRCGFGLLRSFPVTFAMYVLVSFHVCLCSRHEMWLPTQARTIRVTYLLRHNTVMMRVTRCSYSLLQRTVLSLN